MGIKSSFRNKTLYKHHYLPSLCFYALTKRLLVVLSCNHDTEIKVGRCTCSCTNNMVSASNFLSPLPSPTQDEYEHNTYTIT